MISSAPPSLPLGFVTRGSKSKVGFVLFAGLLALLPAALAETDNDSRDALEGLPVQYGLMMDAGSTGSRVHLYRLVFCATFRTDCKMPHSMFPIETGGNMPSVRGRSHC